MLTYLPRAANAARTLRTALPIIILAIAAVAGALLTPGTPPPPAAADTGMATAISAVAITSVPAGAEYVTGETIRVTLTAAGGVVLRGPGTNPSPSMSIQIGANARAASCGPTSPASSRYDCSYTVVAADLDNDGITVARNALVGQIFHNHPGGSTVALHTAVYTAGQNALPNTLTAAQPYARVNSGFAGVDYDADGDGLIEVDSLAKLNAIRYDLDGNGQPASGSAAAFATAFPGFLADSCPDDDDPADGASYDCLGYELTANLDFDTDEDGATHTSGTGDADDDYYNGDAGFTPIGSWTSGNDPNNPYAATFDGNGRTIANLFIKSSTNTVTGGNAIGLFAASTGNLRNLVLLNPYVSNTRTSGGTTAPQEGRTAALVARTNGSGSISNVAIRGGSVIHSQANVETFNSVGGLVGEDDTNNGAITDSMASCAVTVSSNTAGQAYVAVGGLVGYVLTASTITRSYATGAVSVSGADGNDVGGLVGYMKGTVNSSYAAGNVATTSSNTGGSHTVGGLVGELNEGHIRASYAAGAVSAAETRKVGGLAGKVILLSAGGHSIQSSYATGAVSRSSTTGTDTFVGGLIGQVKGYASSVTATYATGGITATVGSRGGLVGGVDTGGGASATPVAHSYWNNALTSSAGDSVTTYSRQTAALRSTLNYANTGIFANWNQNLDGAGGGDEPWDFGTASQYPILQYGHDVLSVSRQRGGTASVDYDANDNNLIDIAALPQLDAIRHDTDGNGKVATGAAAVAYVKAFPNLMSGMGCPAGCAGYELTADLDFDTDGDGDVDANDPGSYANWPPLPQYTTVFDGNGYTIANLNINNSTRDGRIGMFGILSGGSAVIRSVGLISPTVRAAGELSIAGALVGQMQGGAKVYAAYVSGGAVTSDNSDSYVGGLVGNAKDANTSIRASYNRGAAVRANSTNTYAGGLAGHMEGNASLTASYAAAVVNNAHTNGVAIAAAQGGLTGYIASGAATVTNSYWDTIVGPIDSGGGTGRTTNQLQTPTEYGDQSTDIYMDWNVDVDNDGENDDPWDFGTASNYPILKYGRYAGGLARQRDGATDHDTDNDDLIEVGTLAQLDAVRYDLDGDGIPANTAAAAAFQTAFPDLSRAGCPNGCQGYELTAHLDFDTDGDGSTYTLSGGTATGDADDAYYNGGAGWVPIGTGADGSLRPYTGQFNGRGYTISNLFIDAARLHFGLFDSLDGAEVSSLGLVDVYIKASNNASDTGELLVGTLAGDVDGEQSTNIRYVYATGELDITATDSVWMVAGGLLGSMGRGLVAASWSSVELTIASTTDAPAFREMAGGLVGLLNASGGKVATVLTSYATGDITATRNSASGGITLGGLVGFAWSNRVNITASYATGRPTCTATGGATCAVAGLLGAGLSGSNLVITASYWDSTLFTGSSTRGAGHATNNLQSPLMYGTTGIYATWDDHDVDNADGDGNQATGADAPWDFGTGSQYPILKFGHDAFSISQQRGGTGGVDYDANDNNLIDVDALVELDAVRWDLDGNGLVTGDDAIKYAAAYPNMAPGMGCPAGCAGYELRGHLNFDTDGDGDVDSMDPGSYPNWDPIGSTSSHYAARFAGNGYTIRNLTMNRSSTAGAGLFAATSGTSVISGVGLLQPNVTAQRAVGALVGLVHGKVTTSYSIGGTVRATESTGSNSIAGGLVGFAGTNADNANASIIASYSSTAVSTASSAGIVGGLAGRQFGDIHYSYAVGSVTGGNRGGLVGLTGGAGWSSTGSYFNSDVHATSSSGTGRTTSQLRTPTGYTDDFANWNVDVDGDPSTGDDDGNDDPWDFGTASQYPVLKHTGRSLAWQGRGGFAVTRNGAAITEPLTLDEGAAAITIGIALATAPENRVGVSVSTDNAAVTVDVDGDNTFAQSELLPGSFLADWDTPKTISIRAAEDADVANIMDTLTLTAADSVSGQLSGYAGIRRVVDVLVDDDDTAAITLSPTALTVTEEGADGTYTLVLSNQPAADVTVTITNDNSALLSIDTASHTFEAATSGMTNSWDTARTVTVSTMHDGDNTDDVVTLTHTAAGANSGYAGLTADLRVTVEDDDIPNIELSEPVSLTIDENATDTYTVELTVAPTADVTVTVTATGATIDGPDTGSDFTATETLTFTPTDYSTAQTITVQPVDDDDLRNAEATIAHRVTATTDGRYTGKTRDLPVPITNTDTGDIVFSVASLQVIEAGAAVTYGVSLDHRPAEDATVAISVSNSNLATVSPDTLTFRRAGWSATGLQTVTVTAPADGNGSNEGITLTHEGGNAVSGMSSGYDTPVTAGLTVNVLDSTAPELTLSTTSLGVSDGGNIPYQVQLAAAPASDVTIAITSNDPGRATVNPTSLTFNSGNYNTDQEVRVTTTSDGDNINDAVVITHTPTIQGIVNPATTLPVIIGEANDESVPTRIAAPPAGGSATFNIPGSTGDATVTSGAGVPSGITISTVQALPADLDFTLAAPGPEVPTRGGRYSLNGASIVDITLGATQSLPTGGVELCLPRGRDAVLLLRYDAAARAWQEVANPVVRGDQVCAVVTEFSVFGAGRPAGVELLRPATLPEFGEGGSAEVTVLVQDTTTAAVRVSWAVSGSGGITPGDFGNAANTAPLTSLPTGTITVPAGTNATAVIRIPIYDDNAAEGVERFTVRITQAAGGETDFSSETVTVAIALSDPSLDLRGPSGGGAGSGAGSGGSGGTGAGAGDSGSDRAADAPVTESYQLVITEGESNAYTMALSAVPAGTVTVVIHSNHDGVTTNPPSLTFDASNWDTPQRVTVNAAQDGDDDHDQATLTHILTDADGDVIEIIDRLRLFVVDTDPPDDDDDIC